MSDSNLPSILRPAPRGSKRGWVTVTGQLPPETAERFLRLVREDGRRRTDLVAEALAEYVERRAA